jgi:hypothetical protein
MAKASKATFGAVGEGSVVGKLIAKNNSSTIVKNLMKTEKARAMVPWEHPEAD